MNTAAIRVGRLLEIRALSYRSAAEVDLLFALIGKEVAKLPAEVQLVAVTDWRYLPVMSDSAAEQALIGITRNNPRVLRSAALASRDSPIAVLQFLRLVRESKHASRRLFFDASELATWLGEVMMEDEQARLREFLNEPIQAFEGRRRTLR